MHLGIVRLLDKVRVDRDHDVEDLIGHSTRDPVATEHCGLVVDRVSREVLPSQGLHQHYTISVDIVLPPGLRSTARVPLQVLIAFQEVQEASDFEQIEAVD